MSAGNCSLGLESNGLAIDCIAAPCEVHSGASLAVISASATGCVFKGWSGGSCQGEGTCVAEAGVRITATFSREAWPMNVTRMGTGEGSISIESLAPLRTCDEGCTFLLAVGAQAQIKAVPGSMSTLSPFTGPCVAGLTGQCTLVGDQARTVAVHFDPINSQRLELTVSGDGIGAVESTPPGIRCGTDGGICALDFPKNSQVMLRATPFGKSILGPWTGQLCTGADCAVQMNTDELVGISFLETRQLQVSLDGGASGAVDVNGVRHALPFVASLARRTMVRIVARPDPDDTSLGFSGLPCQEVHPLRSCTFSLAEDTSGVLSVQRFIQWAIGGWSGYLAIDGMQPGTAGAVDVLASFAGMSSFATPPLSSVGSNNLLFEVTEDAGIGRWSRTSSGRLFDTLYRNAAGLFALGRLPSSGAQTVQWGGFDGGPSVPGNSALAIVHFDEAQFQPDRLVRHFDGGIEGPFSPLYLTALSTDATVGFIVDTNPRIVSFSSDFNSIRYVFSAAMGPGFFATERSSVVISAAPLRDAGYGIGNCSGVANYPGQTFLAEVSEDGGCIRMVDVNGPAHPLKRYFFPGTTVPTYYEVDGAGLVNPSLALSQRKSDLSETWRSMTTSENGPRGQSGRSINVLALRPWSAGQLLGIFQQGAQVDYSTQYLNQDGIQLDCPPAAFAGNTVFAAHDAMTGELLWTECLPGGLSSEVGYSATHSEPLGRGILLAFYVSTSSPVPIAVSIGSKTLMANPGSAILVYVTPPR